MLELPRDKKILVLAAHPDDEALGCGATISKLSSDGNYVELVTFTDGISSRGKGDRTSTAIQSAEVLGIAKVHSGNFPDNAMDSVPLLSLCKFIEESVSFTPDLIFTHHPDCLNVDHGRVYSATVTAFRPQRGESMSIYSYYVPSSTDYNPLNNFQGNMYIDVKDHVETKIKCLREVYGEEMREYPHSRSYRNVENLMKVWGSEVGLEYAEKFQLIRQVV